VLVRESFATVVLSVACLASLLWPQVWPRPLFFYVIRYCAAGNDPAREAAFNAHWQYPGFRRYIRNVTLLWGIVYLVEFPVRLYLVYTLSIKQYLVVGPLIFYAVLFAVIAFTISYARRLLRRAAQTSGQGARMDAVGGDTAGPRASR
jgi:hypothetical protein